MTLPDSAAPFVLSTHDLARQPGSSRTHQTTVAAPEDLGIAVIAVPAGSRIELDLLLEAVMEGVLVTGLVRAQARGACVRCLDEVDLDLEVDIQELFVYPERLAAANQSGDGAAEQDRELIDDRADLEPAVRDSIVLELPFQPVCRTDCPGLCPDCGYRLELDPDHHHEVTDPRWSALAAVFDVKKES